MAAWIARIYLDHAAWLAERGGAVHAVFLLEWVTVQTAFPDVMHCKHLGVDMHIAGSTLWLICYSGMLPGTNSKHSQ